MCSDRSSSNSAGTLSSGKSVFINRYTDNRYGTRVHATANAAYQAGLKARKGRPVELCEFVRVDR